MDPHGRGWSRGLPSLSIRDAALASRDPDFLIRYATSGVMVVPRAFSGGGDARGDRYPGHRVVPVMPGVCPTPYRARATVYITQRERLLRLWPPAPSATLVGVASAT